MGLVRWCETVMESLKPWTSVRFYWDGRKGAETLGSQWVGRRGTGEL